MWRALVYLALFALAAWGAVQLADRPGTVEIVWSDYRVNTSVAVAAVGLVALAMALAFLWAVVRWFTRLPGRWTKESRARRRARGYAAVSRGMVAVGAGDPLSARRYAKEAERLLGAEPLTLLLKAQSAQVSGDRGAAESAFQSLTENQETRVLGLRGLFVEARRRGNVAEAQVYAAEAAKLLPSAAWANDAVLEAQSAAGEWREAIASLERRASIGLVDRDTAKRHRAVLLAADAQTRMERNDEEGALAGAQVALKLAPDLVPAAVLAGQLLSRDGAGRRADLRRAARVVETAWKAQPHPDLAETYLTLRAGDSALDRLKRAETLAKWSSWDPEARLALAHTALDARDFKRARQTLEPLLRERPTQRVCLLMADIEQAEHGRTSGRAREWLARAGRAPRDPAWIADGVVSDRWAPVSPVTGRLDAFRWEAPPDVLVAPETARLTEGSDDHDVVGDLDDRDDHPPVAVPTAAAVLAATPPPDTAPAAGQPSPEALAVSEPAAAVTEPSPAPGLPPETVPAEPIPEPTAGLAADAPRPTLDASPAVAETPVPPSGPDGKPNGAAVPLDPHPAPGAASAAPVVFPVPHAPDDPGPKTTEQKPARYKLFG